MMNAYEYAKYLNLALVNIGNVPRFTESKFRIIKVERNLLQTGGKKH